ncbi:MAG: DUF1573 domain-containing protein [Anaerolineae bacterium]
MATHESPPGEGGLISINMSRGVYRGLIALIGIGAGVAVLAAGLWYGTRRGESPAVASAPAQAAAPVQAQPASGNAPPAALDVAVRPAGDDVPIGDNPRLAIPDLVDKGYVVDFGDEPADGGPTTLTATVRNTGVEDLVVSNVRANCSCTAVTLEPMTVPPQGEGTLSITHDPQKMLAHGSTVINHQVTISSNDPAASDVVVDMRGVVVQ